ncbi:hypothetical protein V1477_020339 [Vespula maculifrons]|uniref:Uncharacterized protein n=1 Tax=Vespula maculifrons TaxID=7453 RepID=A0ABD2ALP5_VESMC
MLSPQVLPPVAVESPVVSLWRSYARVRDERRWKWREQGMGIRKGGIDLRKEEEEEEEEEEKKQKKGKEL